MASIAWLSLWCLSSRRRAWLVHIKKSTPAFQSPGACRGCGMVLGTPEKGWTGLLAPSSYQNPAGAGCLILSGLQEKISCVPQGPFWCKCSVWKNARQEERPFPGLPCAERENGWDEAWRRGTLLSQWGILPENSRRSSSAGITRKKKKSGKRYSLEDGALHFGQTECFN